MQNLLWSGQSIQVQAIRVHFLSINHNRNNIPNTLYTRYLTRISLYYLYILIFISTRDIIVYIVYSALIDLSSGGLPVNNGLFTLFLIVVRT